MNIGCTHPDLLVEVTCIIIVPQSTTIRSPGGIKTITKKIWSAWVRPETTKKTIMCEVYRYALVEVKAAKKIPSSRTPSYAYWRIVAGTAKKVLVRSSNATRMRF